MNKKEYLQKVLDTHSMNQINDLRDKYIEKRDEIKDSLNREYDKMYSIINSGSYAKSTAINIKFDLDIVAPFKRNAFSTLDEMLESVYDFLNEKYNDDDDVTVRKQKVSVGVIFEEDNYEIDIDVVPGRELSRDSYSDDKDLNLNINDYNSSDTSTYIKTNIQSQIDHIKGKDNARKIIKLLKVWKKHHDKDYKSFLIELITIKAFDNNDINGNLWKKLKFVMNYIKENITKESFNLIDPGNSNNNVIKTLTKSERKTLANEMKTIIDNIEINENIYLKYYFPTNEEFDDEYETGNNLKSYPPKTKQFG